jgi:hypothetical protein
MTSFKDLFSSVLTTLETGKATLTELGEGPSGVLDLDQPGGMDRYASILRPQIQLALRRNKRERTVLIVLLIVFFAVAVCLAVYDRFYGSGKTGRLLLVPGLGAAAVWPVQRLMALSHQALALEIFPGMMPILGRKQAAKLAGQFLSGGLK